MSKKEYLQVIGNKMDNLSFDQLTTLFHVYLYLDTLCDFFMPEKTHIAFINRYYENPAIRQPDIFKNFMLHTAVKNTYPSRYSNVLTAIEMLEHNRLYNEIIAQLLRKE